MRKYHLVDFAAHFQKGFRNHIVPIAGVPHWVKSFNSFGCYATYFFYSDDILTYMSARRAAAKATIAGYEGKVWAPFFPIDLDHPDLSLALESVRILVSFLTDRWGTDPNGIQVYFSGSKGFHLMLDSRLFGRIAPSQNLPLIFDSMRRHFALELDEGHRETVDLAIKDRVRLLRLPNTVHEKSGLFKVNITLDELQTFGPDDVLASAKAARSLPLTDETGFLSRTPVQENLEASQFFRRIRRQARRITRKPFAYRFRRPEDLAVMTFPCAGAQRIWESHVKPGYRNNCAIRLASEFRLLGLTEEEARDKLFEWNETHAIDLPHSEILNVARSAYQHPFPYRYSCRDDLLRRFCPLRDYQACEAHLTRASLGP